MEVVRDGARRSHGRLVTSNCFGCRCFDVPAIHACPPCLPGRPPPNQMRPAPPAGAGAMHHRWAVATPHPGRKLQTLTAYPMPVAPPLRAALLHFRQRSCPRIVVPFISPCTLRTMSSQPSLQAANDFLTFVNNSPTRMRPFESEIVLCIDFI